MPPYFVAASDPPGSAFDDWIDAFAHDYDDLRSLDDLHFLIDDYLEQFNPDYDDEEDKQHWYPGADKLLVLTRRYGVATLLDYRQGPQAPGVLLVDLDLAVAQQTRKVFDSFDAFFGALRIMDTDRHSRGAEVDRATLAERGYDPGTPQRFWANSHRNAISGASDAQWQTAEERLGLPLPPVFRAIYRVLDGGAVGWPFHPRLGLDVDGMPQSPFADGSLLPIAAWTSLKTLSDRLVFPEATAYAALHAQPERLVVISAAFDCALLLDYRRSDEPHLLYCRDLMQPDTAFYLGTSEIFLSALRQRANPWSNDALPMADTRLSPRGASHRTFWLQAGGVGVTEEALAGFARRFGIALPQEMVALMAERNGGAVRFRYLPPLVSNPNGYGPPRIDMRSTEWKNLFPGGIWPLEEWVRFEEFCRQHQRAMEQDLAGELLPELRSISNTMESDSVVEPALDPQATLERGALLIVIGTLDSHALSLLDLSKGVFKQNCHLLRADYDAELDEYRPVVQPASLAHAWNNTLHQLRARIDEL